MRAFISPIHSTQTQLIQTVLIIHFYLFAIKRQHQHRHYSLPQQHSIYNFNICVCKKNGGLQFNSECDINIIQYSTKLRKKKTRKDSVQRATQKRKRMKIHHKMLKQTESSSNVYLDKNLFKWLLLLLLLWANECNSLLLYCDWLGACCWYCGLNMLVECRCEKRSPSGEMIINGFVCRLNLFFSASSVLKEVEWGRETRQETKGFTFALIHRIFYVSS